MNKAKGWGSIRATYYTNVHGLATLCEHVQKCGAKTLDYRLLILNLNFGTFEIVKKA